MLMFFASDVVVSKGYQNTPALRFSEKGDFVRFRVGQKVYDPRAEDNHRWINITVKSFDPVLVDRIRKMGLKEGSFISLSGRYDEDVWEDEETKEKRSMPCVILDNLEYSGGKRPSDGQKTASNTAAPPHLRQIRRRASKCPVILRDMKALAAATTSSICKESHHTIEHGTINAHACLPKITHVRFLFPKRSLSA